MRLRVATGSDRWSVGWSEPSEHRAGLRPTYGTSIVLDARETDQDIYAQYQVANILAVRSKSI